MMTEVTAGWARYKGRGEMGDRHTRLVRDLGELSHRG